VPINDFERLAVVPIMLIGCGFFAYTLAEVGKNNNYLFFLIISLSLFFFINIETTLIINKLKGSRIKFNKELSKLKRYLK
jgi:hypothetical protein